jgi:hypothetical protein
MEGNFNNKTIKPTLKSPSPMGKQVDTNFKKEIRKSGMNLKEEATNKNSLKKKIFKLDKMETLVHSDEFLGQKFNELKGDDPETIWGYHWNEVILNALFNKHVLNSPKYLDKYKNTRAVEKTRRGEEGIKQLQNDLGKEQDATSGAEERKDALMGGEKEKVDELFGFGGAGTPLPMNKRSKNDTYFVDMTSKKLLAPVPYNTPPQEKQAIIQKYVGKPNVKQISWYDAVKQRIQGVPTEVPDGNIAQMDQEVAQRFPSGTQRSAQTMPALTEYGEDSGGQDMHWGMYKDQGSSTGSRSVILGSAWNVAQAIEPELSDNYQEKEVEQAVELYWTDNGLDFQRLANDDFWEDLYFNINDIKRGKKGVAETTGAASAGSFAPPLNAKQEVTETTTSASSGQYSGKAIWAKNPAQSRFANKTAWKGGKIVSESVVAENKNYLIDPTAYKKYLLKNEIIDMMNESVEIGEGENFQQHAAKMLAKLNQYAAESPELKNDADFNELIKITAQRAGQSQQQQSTNSTSATQSTIPTISEDHLNSKQEKIDFIINNGATQTIDELTAMTDEEVDALYNATEQALGIGENSYHKAALATDLKNTGRDENASASDALETLQTKDGLFKGKWNEGDTIVNDMTVDSVKDNIKPSVGEGIFGNSNSELNLDQIVTMIDTFKQSPESAQFRNNFVKAKDYVKSKAGNIAQMPQLKMWLDQNMPQLSNYVGLLWGNWDLAPKLNETMNKIQYKEYLKKRINESPETFKSLNEGQKKEMLKSFHNDFLNESSMLDDNPNSMINTQDSSMAKSMESPELNVDGQPTPNAVSGVAQGQTEGYDSDDIKAKAPIADKLADYSDDDMESQHSAVDNEPAASPEKAAPSYHHSGSEDTETIKDAEKFRAMLQSKYGVDNVSALSPAQRQELMKSMNFGGTPVHKAPAPEMDFNKFTASDSEKAAYKARDEKRLGFLAQNADRIQSYQDYQAAAQQFKNTSGENMHHPMAILASIQQLPKESPLRNKLKNIENVLTSGLSKSKAPVSEVNPTPAPAPAAQPAATAQPVKDNSKQWGGNQKWNNENRMIQIMNKINNTDIMLNEDRKTSSQLNVEKLGDENAKNFKKDSAKEDGLEQDKTYPKDNGIIKAPVWPDPAKFYIEQDLEKVQREAKTMEDIEKAALAKSKGALENNGNATADGKSIPKRNLTKEEAYSLAMNRGKGMQDIVYDNKPSEKFEDRMKKDMGEEVYKTREDKMKYNSTAPMYNKDTQPTEKGDKTEQDNKFAKGYNNESVTAKYRDELGKLKLVEFNVHDLEEVTTINENATKLSLDGLGNKYSLVGKKINEHEGFQDLLENYSFYLVENKVVAIEKTKVIVETKIQMKGNINEGFNKMKHLMNYKPNEYVDTKKSAKF